MPNKVIEVWAPRWKDRKVLIACHKVSGGVNTIRFTRAGTSTNGDYSIDGSVARGCPIGTNGKIDCYIVPLSLLWREVE